VKGVRNAARAECFPDVPGLEMEACVKPFEGKTRSARTAAWSGQDFIMAAIERVLAGDADAYREIYDATNEPLRGFIGRRHAAQGEDFISEVAIRTHEYAFEHLGAYRADRRAAFQTWLNWQSRNVACRVRAERCERRFGLRFGLNHTWEPTVEGPGATTVSERDRVLREEFRALGDEDRLCIALHDLGGRTFAATARRMGTTMARVRWARHRGLKRLRSRLRERGIRPLEEDHTPAPIWTGWTVAEPARGYTTSATDILSVEPPGDNSATR
jgi:RNA polymerase sigma-70 factor (ECF subfamily)